MNRNRSTSSMELIILDMRYFIDEALTFLEAYEQVNCTFATDETELATVRQYAIEFTRYVFDFKRLLWAADSGVAEINAQVDFSNEFKSKRILFFRKIFERTSRLDRRVCSVNRPDLVKLYSRIVLKIARTTNQFIGHMEFTRWHRSYLIEILDKLVTLCNDFSCVFEKFCMLLKKERRVVARRHKTKVERKPPDSVTTITGRDEEDEEESVDGSSQNTSTTIFVPSCRFRFRNFFSSKRSRTCTRTCPCIFLILGFIILFLFILFLRWILLNPGSSSSSLAIAAGSTPVFTFSLDQAQAKPPEKKVVEIFKLPYTFYSQTTAAVTTTAAATTVTGQSDLFDWARILEYMKDFYILVASFTTFVSVEWLMNR